MDEHWKAKEIAAMSIHKSLLPTLSPDASERLPFFQALGVIIALLNHGEECVKENINTVISQITPLLRAGNAFIWLDDKRAPLGFSVWKSFSLEQHRFVLAAPSNDILYSDALESTSGSSSTEYIWLTKVVSPFADSDLMISLLQKNFKITSPESEVWVLPELAERLSIEAMPENGVEMGSEEARRLW